MAFESDLGFDFIVDGDCGALSVVKDEHVSLDVFSGNDIVVLRHVSGSVYLSVVVDSSLYLDSLYLRIHQSIRIFTSVPVVFDFFLFFQRQTHFYNQELVLFIPRGVSSQKEFLYRRIAAYWDCSIWKPLHGQRRPCKGVAKNCVIKEWAVLLPDLVFLSHHLVLYFFLCLVFCWH